MTVDLGTSQTPRATRAFLPGWRDPRLWIGVALVAASVVIGARLFGAETTSIQIWAADRDLQVGEQVTSDDLVLISLDHVEDDVRSSYFLRDEELPESQVVTRAVGAGELLPRAALGEEASGSVEVAVWAPAVAIPSRVGPGSVVDVWVTDADGEAQLALHSVTVVDAPTPAEDFGPSGDRQVVLAVPEEFEQAVGDVVSAAHAGTVSITRRS